MDMKLLCDVAYAAIIEELAERQERINRFEAGKASFASQRFFRLSLAGAYGTAWKAREAWAAKEYEVDIARVQKLMPLAEELERLYSVYHGARDEAFAAGVAEILKRSQRK